ncbi:MAG: enoyl-CoA hydratase-related protein [Deferribacterota bacterium]|nr:enoyl-CoA hydratase-related protein [Deferribacterota bacterium]
MNNCEIFHIDELKIDDLKQLFDSFKGFEKNRSKDIFMLKIYKNQKDITKYLDYFKSLNKSDIQTYSELSQKIAASIINSRKLVVAESAGYVFDGYFELSLIADLFLTTKNSEFGYPCLDKGVIPHFGGLKILTRAIFEQFIKYITLTGEMLNADEYYKRGIISKVFDTNEALTDYTKHLTCKIKEKSVFALGLVKEIINRAPHLALEDALLIEQNAFCISFASKDKDEGIKAFLENRKALFTTRWEDINNAE